MQFEKWQACGNDFILLKEEVSAGLAKKLCDRHYGIGADGVIMVLPSEVSEVKMRIYNRDGSEAEMCGNGIRCVGRQVCEERGLQRLSVETLAGEKELELEGEYISVEMGCADIKWSGQIILPDGREQNSVYLTVGNPHCVIFIDELKPGELERYGSRISKLPKFPAGANVEFVTPYTTRRVRARVWERGVGKTLACGTGACASAYASYKAGATTGSVTVSLDGGDVEIEIEDEKIRMIGEAKRVYKGELEIPTDVNE